MCRDMGGVKFEWPIQSKPNFKRPGCGAWRCNAMSQLANWLLSLAVDAQRARDATYPASADSPVALHTVVVVGAALIAWVG